jgi:hypothetical protein
MSSWNLQLQGHGYPLHYPAARNVADSGVPGLIFTAVGAHQLKGVPGTWELYSVVDG